MSSFINADGSGLVGGINPNGSGQAIQVDNNGNLLTQQWIRMLSQQGKAFIGTTSLFSSSAGTNTYPLCIFNPANSGKTIAIYSLHASSGSAAATSISVFMQVVTSNPVYGSSVTIANLLAGGPSSSIAGSCTWSSSNQTGTPPYHDVMFSTTPIEMLNTEDLLTLPKGSANGVILFLQTYGAGYCTISARWLEI